MRGPLELPVVRGWRTPPPLVDIPIFGLSGWLGPRWMLLYDGNRIYDGKREAGLRLVQLAFGDVESPPDPRRWSDVTTYAKLPAKVNASGAGTLATTLAEVGSDALTMLTERGVAHLPESSAARKALLQDLNQHLTTTGALTFRSDQLPARWWKPATVTVDDQVVDAFSAELGRSWSVCADLGPVFVALKSTGDRPDLVALETVTDLRPYRMPGLD